tara:strand:+ start:70 stop:225 length:156 start_codon:yes stop_codon:yes gene_type:complete
MPQNLNYPDQTLYDIISGNGSIKVSVELSPITIVSIFIAFVLAGVVTNLIK